MGMKRFEGLVILSYSYPIGLKGNSTKKRYIGLNLKEIRTNSKKVAAFRVDLQVFSPAS